MGVGETKMNADMRTSMDSITDIAQAVGGDRVSFEAAWRDTGGALPRVAREGIACYAEGLNLPYAQVCGILVAAQLAHMAAEEQLLGKAENVFHEDDGSVACGDELFAALVQRNVRSIQAALRACRNA
jgi:hypothetical protein